MIHIKLNEEELISLVDAYRYYPQRQDSTLEYLEAVAEIWRQKDAVAKLQLERERGLKHHIHVWSTMSVTNSYNEETQWTCIGCGKQRRGSSPY